VTTKDNAAVISKKETTDLRAKEENIL